MDDIRLYRPTTSMLDVPSVCGGQCHTHNGASDSGGGHHWGGGGYTDRRNRCDSGGGYCDGGGGGFLKQFIVSNQTV